MIATSLEERILDAFPSGNYGLLALLRLMDIVETTTVNTAAVECAELPRMLINPVFVAAHADTPERLLMLVMHELHHVLLGHTRLFPRATSTDNLIFDAVINALICRMFPGPEYTSFLTCYYSEDRFPECLLRPATGWNPSGLAPVPRALEVELMCPVRNVYRALYSETGANYQELYHALRSLLSKVLTVPLIGNHGAELDQLHGMVFEVVRSIVERWPQPPNPIAGRSWSELLDLSRVTRRPSNRAVLRALLRKVAGRGAGARHGVRGPQPLAVTSPVPAPDRRSVVLRAMGVPQLLYRAETTVLRPLSCERVHVYLDVSGSIGDYKSALYSAVADCAAMVHPAIHLFSTIVHDISLRELRLGECRTTNGTSIECVASHMRKHGVRRAVLVTDGAVGRPGAGAARTLSRCVLGVALAPGYSFRGDLEPVARYWAELEEEKQ
ncbi:MAG: hypothetical protein LLG20_07660 [Acidobacteriales bacterium]|nr:hypothetical protein [Terriglobales bacterium]